MFQKIKNDQIEARKNRDTLKANLLTTLMSECLAVGKKQNREPTEAECLSVLKKFIKNTSEILVLSQSNIQAGLELQILNNYLPEQLSEARLQNMLEGFKLVHPDSKMGDYMKYLQTNHSGLYDGKVASQIIKELINN